MLLHKRTKVIRLDRMSGSSDVSWCAIEGCPEVTGEIRAES